MKQTGKFSLKWKDAVNSIIMMLIANLLMIIMAAADGKFPTLNDFEVGLINSVKFAIIPYLLKNFFTDDVKVANKTLASTGTESIAPNDAEQQNKKP